ncbi:hypothetical protein KM043_000719 [Ampulex compressa]|nr:hypothetical protein KM043_000719 [Ampulex compressa]
MRWKICLTAAGDSAAVNRPMGVADAESIRLGRTETPREASGDIVSRQKEKTEENKGGVSRPGLEAPAINFEARGTKGLPWIPSVLFSHPSPLVASTFAVPTCHQEGREAPRVEERKRDEKGAGRRSRERSSGIGRGRGKNTGRGRAERQKGTEYGGEGDPRSERNSPATDEDGRGAEGNRKARERAWEEGERGIGRGSGWEGAEVK